MTENGGGNSKSGSNAINWATVVLVAVTGGGNFLETRAGNQFNEAEIRRATQEIHDIYPKLEEAVQRQKQIQAQLDQMIRSRSP